MDFLDILRKKREGQHLSPQEIAFIVKGYTCGEIPDYQMSALLMAICCRGMDDEETASLTEEMLRSGEVIRPEEIPGPKVDKHSTGGVGDKVSLVLAPLVASLGVKVPMISGRSLGHTGGTLDKLESIPGFKTQLSLREFKRNIEKMGLSIIGPTRELVPVDNKLYALRDVTSTVESIPLITASILSKKFVEGIDGLVLDVKTGSGAFMKGLEEARSLARSLIQTAWRMGKPAVALITDMNQPLGRMVGNATEVQEAMEILHGGGPPDVVELTLELGHQMLRLAGLCQNREDARRQLKSALEDGSAWRKFKELVACQGGRLRCLEDFHRLISKKVYVVTSQTHGYVNTIDTRKMGQAAIALGAGRRRLGDKIDPSVGYEVLAKLGDRVEKGQPLLKIFYKDKASLEEARNLLLSAYSFSTERPTPLPLVYETLEQVASSQ
ncbi:MAG TPA: thymidine phosphorylase [Candidatus Tripitaka californicus]|uniref:thymidine phosphorylase n=1 Tax=Candidatus Tripitaka californicus TaxID=3367616 RepID=UPI0040285B1D|nr:thymidine phosphorylase [Planctomycetota bacterium]